MSNEAPEVEISFQVYMTQTTAQMVTLIYKVVISNVKDDIWWDNNNDNNHMYYDDESLIKSKYGWDVDLNESTLNIFGKNARSKSSQLLSLRGSC